MGCINAFQVIEHLERLNILGGQNIENVNCIILVLVKMFISIGRKIRWCYPVALHPTEILIKIQLEIDNKKVQKINKFRTWIQNLWCNNQYKNDPRGFEPMTS